MEAAAALRLLSFERVSQQAVTRPAAAELRASACEVSHWNIQASALQKGRTVDNGTSRRFKRISEYHCALSHVVASTANEVDDAE
jgi:hypothetical protein